MIQWHTGAERVRRLAYSPDGRLLASANYRATVVQLWKPDGTPVARLSFGRSVRAFALDPNGRHLVAALWRLPIAVCDIATQVEVGHLAIEGECYTLTYSPDGTKLVAAFWGGVACWYRLAAGFAAAWPADPPRRPDAAFRLDASSAAFTPDGTRLVTNGHAGPCVLNVPPTRCLRYVPQPTGRYARFTTDIAVSPDGRRVASSRRVWDISLWSLDSLAKPIRLPGLARDQSIRGLVFTPDGSRVLAASTDGLVRSWDADTGSPGEVWDFGIKNLQSLAVAPDGLTAAAGSHDGRIVVWDL